MSTAVCAPTAADYAAAFAAEQAQTYPMVDAFEARMGFALDRERLESAARVLACPLKKSPPNWQHGRVLYAAAMRYLADYACEPVNILDIGTAKGFSALCLRWALYDSGKNGLVTSVDVIDPAAAVARNTVAEVDGLLTLHQTLTPWREAGSIRFARSSGLYWLETHEGRINIAFVDGTHNPHTVAHEGEVLAQRQEHGDLAIFDDVNRPELLRVVRSLADAYVFDVLEVLPTRHYAIGVRL